MLKNQLMFSADDALFDSSSSAKMDNLDSMLGKFPCNLYKKNYQKIYKKYTLPIPFIKSIVCQNVSTPLITFVMKLLHSKKILLMNYSLNVIMFLGELSCTKKKSINIQSMKHTRKVSTNIRDTVFPKVLKFHLPDLCNHSLEHLEDFSS